MGTSVSGVQQLEGARLQDTCVEGAARGGEDWRQEGSKVNRNLVKTWLRMTLPSGGRKQKNNKHPPKKPKKTKIQPRTQHPNAGRTSLPPSTNPPLPLFLPSFTAPLPQPWLWLLLSGAVAEGPKSVSVPPTCLLTLHLFPYPTAQVTSPQKP